MMMMQLIWVYLYQVTDDLTQFHAGRKTVEMVKTDDEVNTGIQASYTMGGMTLAGGFYE